MAISLLCLFLITFVSLFLIGKKIKGSKWNLPPSPPKLPVIGNLHQLGEQPHRSLQRLAKRTGHVMLLHLGFVPVIVISSKEGAEEVLRTHDLDCCSRPKLFGWRLISRGFKDIGSTPYGREWRERRKFTVSEFFSFKKVQSFGYIREEECNFLVKKVSESAVDQSPVDLSKALFWLTSSILFRVAFGQSFHESEFIDQEKIEELIFEGEEAQASFTFSDSFPIAGLGWLGDWISGQHKRLKDVFFKIDALFQHVIDDHLKPGRSKDNRDIVDLMLDVMHKQGEDDSLKLTIDHIKGILTNIFMAGIDTGAITMIWAMTELARNPEVMKKVQGEIRDRLGNDKERITNEDVDKVPFLNMVIKETFRLHPAAPLLLPRETMTHIKIQGYDIPPKRRILVNAWAIGRDPKYWTNPEEFNPERFIDSPVDYKGKHFELLPFGSGRRICPGIAMAIATVELGLLNLLYFFDWRVPDGMTHEDIDTEEAGSLTVVKKVPLKLVPVRVQ
ncbi:PREDICTED: cytochrome P450 71B17-like isoform X4 [Camelina sativa]|uniref:Cytochrome P450 71B17-like isoform X1 n=1 Tax=Camelina sativa TaxID=90675 RepID=A0ABM0ZDK3_CAMSA|nr:PREDICTED: cytochrome P450 71B17-like isoform X1 [Camelina sativa]XP_010514263.1 PREDICTED: cytochrome P450 71B17-like isoform X2 [Camelina sativa]XP_019102187.1 PREDICTED: cytochrome P450 71B17-like isoform X3 [Camelina sativa]XP_019102188.1 PREDICTED: cytochrome P450 71B17-like isoform X4 [Camelina sativa]